MRAYSIGIDLISVLGMPPPQHVEVAAKLGCTQVTMGAAPISLLKERYERWAFRSDPVLMRDTKAALRDHGVSVAGGEGWFIMPHIDMRNTGGDLDMMAELGARAISACGLDPDRARCLDQLAVLTEMAAERGMRTSIEFVASLPIGTLADALAGVAHVGRPEIGLVIDAMHLFRSGGTAADVAALDPALIRHVQICDAPIVPVIDDYGHEASFERLCPGAGELPLAELMAVLPPGAEIGLEIPMKARAAAGEDAITRLGPCVEATRRLIDAADATA